MFLSDQAEVHLLDLGGGLVARRPLRRPLLPDGGHGHEGRVPLHLRRPGQPGGMRPGPSVHLHVHGALQEIQVAMVK